MFMARLRLKSRCGDKWMACSLCSEKQQKKKRSHACCSLCDVSDIFSDESMFFFP